MARRPRRSRRSRLVGGGPADAVPMGPTQPATKPPATHMMSLKDDLPKPLHPLSSSPPIMQSLTLPVEVVEGVVDCCSGDATTLLAFSLTCRDIHPRSILVLYTHVELEDRDQLFDFCDALKAKPERQPIVQSLLIYGEDFAPYPLLSMLPALRHIKFEGGGEQSILQWYPSTLLCCRRSGSSIRNLTIRDYTFSTCTAFLRILSAFPTIENLACMSLYVEKKGEANPLVQKSLSRQLRLRTLNIREDVDEDITQSLLGIASLDTAGPLRTLSRHKTSSTPPVSSNDTQQILFTLWIRASTEGIKRAAKILAGPVAMKMSTVTVFLLYYNTGELICACRRPADLALLAELEKILTKYPAHRVVVTTEHGLRMNIRKTISGLEEFGRCFAATSEHWSLAEQPEYSGRSGHDSEVTALVVSSDGRWVATASYDSTIILWDARAACISQEWFAHDEDITSLAFSPDGQHLVSAGYDKKVTVWDISGSSHRVATLEGHTHPVVDCTWSGDGAYIASRDYNDDMRLWDGRTFQPLPLDGPNQTTTIKPLFSPDSHWLLVHDRDSCGVRDVGSGAYLALQFEGHDRNNLPSKATFSPESTHVAVGCIGGIIRVCDIETRQEPLLWKAHTDGISDVTFSPDGQLLLSASYDKTLKTWDARTGDVIQVLEGHEDWVRKACFSPCGKYVASASRDGAVRVWKTSDGSCLATLSDHGAWVSHVAYTPNGTMLWSAAVDGTVLGRRVQDFMPDESRFLIDTYSE